MSVLPYPLLKDVTTLYVDLHAHPELSGEEARTAARFADWLARAGYRVTTGVGGHGVVGLLENGEGPLVMLRAELDALPVQERTGLPYASRVSSPVPVMHACGHDLHLAAAAGAASVLAGERGLWRGTVVVVGQPAEETLSGARAMLDDGLHDRFGRPDAVLAQHAAPLPAGMVAHGAGPTTAGSVSLDVVFHGRGGHAAMPHLAVDPVVTAAAVVLRLQGVVAAETAPAEQVVLSVGRLHAGTRGNVIPDRAEISLTVRGFSDAALDRVVTAVHRIVRAESDASGCPVPPEISLASRSPVNHPDPRLTAAVREAHTSAFGEARVTGWPPSMATEDFPLLAPDGVPTAYWMLGTAGPRQWAAAPGTTAAEKLAALPPNHSPLFAPSPRLALPTGITAMVTAARAALGGRSAD
ncbi:amidohydrolase [Streptomyces sp. NRRL B-1677]|uniref:amidohydrolase n=1 Tax=Streptomyces sp. NRRL B-1677 TaxID=2682966 RepID=UPI001892ADBA|nr:amidohydrolase [Streptomyces sp. NRRL B-1677]MBF6047380.1 amidohydrolase [Streptomyces sp. NRRL B-1677]